MASAFGEWLGDVQPVSREIMTRILLTFFVLAAAGGLVARIFRSLMTGRGRKPRSSSPVCKTDVAGQPSLDAQRVCASLDKIRCHKTSALRSPSWFTCCWARAAPSANDDDKGEVSHCLYTEDDVVRAGVPPEAASKVVQLAGEVGARGPEPLSDPTTLWRFLSAREFDIGAAGSMYRESTQWRARLPIADIMRAHGSGEAYATDGSSRAAADPTEWKWRRGTEGVEADFVQKYGYWGRLPICAEADGAPIAVWRIGLADLEGYAREDVIGVLMRGFVAHLEDLLQSGRAASRRSQRIVRARVIIDASGLSLRSLSTGGQMGKVLLGAGKQYFAEITASVTIVRAPRVFTAIYRGIHPFLTPVMRRKICILGEDFHIGLKEHAGIDRICLPRFLGGERGDSEVAAAGRLPVGIGALVKAAAR